MKFLFIFFGLLQFWVIFAQTSNKQNLFISFDSVLNHLEKIYSVDLYFKPQWFEKKSFHNSIMNLSIEEILNLLKNACNCSYKYVDSSSIVFMPAGSHNIDSKIIKSSDYLIIGNPGEYGKYSRASIKGKVRDSKTGEPLTGARVFVDKTQTIAVTNKEGDFSINLPVGEYKIKLSYIGYEDNMYKIRLVGDGSANFEIMEKSVKLDEVVITAERLDNNVVSNQMGMVRLNAKDIKELPVALGEIDIIKSVTLLPGIQTIGEFGTGFNVRGGSADQNLILIEDVPIFNSSHLFGLTSIINPDGLSNVTLFKAGIPAKYGERASSLMDIRMGTSNLEKIKAKGGIGLINSRLTLEVPLLNNKVNLLVGGRTTYSDWLLHEIPDIDLMNSSARFYDMNAYLVVTPNKNNKIILFGYYSDDAFAISNKTHYKYSNTLASIRWNHIINQHFSSSLMVGLSRYDYAVNEYDTLRRSESYSINSQVLYNNFKWNWAWHPNRNHTIDLGFNTVLYLIKPGDLSPYDSESQVIPVCIQKEKANEYAVYISDGINISSKISAELGIRYTRYALKGPDSVYFYQNTNVKVPEDIIDTIAYKNNKIVKTYSGFEPRISMRYSINDVSSVKFSYNLINQYINLVSNTSVMTPSDVWKLSDQYILPLRCDHYTVGYFRNFKQNAIETSVEIYYKTLKDVMECKNGAQILFNNHLETDVVHAKGYNYGAELYIKKNKGRLTGWASYTFSQSMRRTTGLDPSVQINNNQYFPSNYDRPHNVIMNVNYHITRRWRFSSSFAYSTGRPVTLPELKYMYNQYELIDYSDRNKYRLPDYHRLDVSITLDESLRFKKIWKGSWTLSVINLYGRKNAYSVFYQKVTPEESINHKLFNLYKLYIIGRPLPTLTYNFTF